MIDNNEAAVVGAGFAGAVWAADQRRPRHTVWAPPA